MISNIELIFGLANRCHSYGLKEKKSDPNLLPLRNILEICDGVDGAEKYDWHQRDLDELKINFEKNNFTKVDFLNNSLEKIIDVIEKHSLKNGSTYLKGFYVHNQVDEKIIEIYKNYRPLIKNKYPIKLGFSIYKQNEIDLLVKNNVVCEILQIPYNLNINLNASNLQDKGCEIYLRSVFLQGAYFTNLENKFNQSTIDKIIMQKKYLITKAQEYKFSLGQYLFSDAVSHCIFKDYKGIVISTSSLERIRSYITNHKTVECMHSNSIGISDIMDDYLSDPRQWRK